MGADIDGDGVVYDRNEGESSGIETAPSEEKVGGEENE
jgi:hypothetical protein